ncbi:MAG TPA: hypothetical protein VGV61_03145 [Thermoanaerobaculia bacterium]|nr:hypothetical protein [Thermoanaerobaculia bacterium]
MRRRPHALLAPALPLAAMVACYAPALSRGFTSEDFLLIRYLGQHPPWEQGASLFGPWLGIAGIQFFRPVSTLLFALEIAAFGTFARGYLAVHLLVHALAILLVWAIARQLARPLGATIAGLSGAAAALLFALYPLHPNAVVFVASFATLYGGLFALLAFFAYLRYRQESGGKARAFWLLALAAFVLALGSYEAAAVVPVWLVAHDHLVLPSGTRPHRQRIRGWLPFAALLGAYLLLRRHLFGQVVGGYEATRQRLLAPQAASLLRDALLSIQRLHLPRFDAAPSLGTAALALALMTLAPMALFASVPSTRAAARPWLLGWVVMVTAMAPFAFQPVVPASGRYWYIAAAGAALGLAFLAAAIASALPRGGWVVGWLVVAAFTVPWALNLSAQVRHCRAAADLAGAVRVSLLRLPAVSGPRFVTGYPSFLTDAGGVPLAQVFHYGLRDAVTPPFHRPALDIVMLPPLSGNELTPVLRGAPLAAVAAWDPTRSAWRSPDLPPDALPELVTQPDRATPPMGELRLRVSPVAGARFRLLLAAPINGAVFDLQQAPSPQGVLRVPLPLDFLRTNDRLYGSPVYWWVEERDAGGQLIACSRMRLLRRRAWMPGPRDQKRSLSPIE